MKIGLYVHVPFCLQKCHYCGFYSLPVEGRRDRVGLMERYTSRLCDEIKAFFDAGSYTIDTIYFGGGTPVLLPAENLSLILETIRVSAPVEAGAEISIETNPRVISASMGEELTRAGFNRITMGLQTLDRDAHHFIGRAGRPCTIDDLDEFFSIRDVTHCLDIMMGIPGTSLDSHLLLLDTVLAFEPAHLSVYSLSIEEGTPLAKRTAMDQKLETLQGELFTGNAARLTAAGYRHYEISNFCLPGRESRHNLKYWQFLPCAGFGPSAHSFIDGQRWHNRADLDAWLADSDFPRVDDPRTERQAMVEFFMTGLRLLEGASLTSFTKIFECDLPAEILSALDELTGEGSIVREKDNTAGEKIRISASGLLMADNIIYRLVEGLID